MRNSCAVGLPTYSATNFSASSTSGDGDGDGDGDTFIRLLLLVMCGLLGWLQKEEEVADTVVPVKAN